MNNPKAIEQTQSVAITCCCPPCAGQGPDGADASSESAVTRRVGAIVVYLASPSEKERARTLLHEFERLDGGQVSASRKGDVLTELTEIVRAHVMIRGCSPWEADMVLCIAGGRSHCHDGRPAARVRAARSNGTTGRITTRVVSFDSKPARRERFSSTPKLHGEAAAAVAQRDFEIECVVPKNKP